MKRAISLFVSALLLVSMFFAFGSPAQATDIPLHIENPYFEGNLEVDETGIVEETFTVERTGYYIIQTYGFYNVNGGRVHPSFNVSLIDSYGDTAEILIDDRGYDEGLFLYVYLYEDEVYTLGFTGLLSVYFMRLSITNASGLFYEDPPRDGYSSICLIQDVNYNSTIQVEVPNDSEEMAVVSVLKCQSSQDPYTFSVTVDCCTCTRVLIVDPTKENYHYYTDGPVMWHLPHPELVLYSGISYYLVVYQHRGDTPCPDHGLNYVVEITFESSY